MFTLSQIFSIQMELRTASHKLSVLHGQTKDLWSAEVIPPILPGNIIASNLLTWILGNLRFVLS